MRNHPEEIEDLPVLVCEKCVFSSRISQDFKRHTQGWCLKKGKRTMNVIMRVVNQSFILKLNLIIIKKNHIPIEEREREFKCEFEDYPGNFNLNISDEYFSKDLHSDQI